MECRIVTDKKQWDDFITNTQPYHLFVQAWNYGAFNKAMGDQVFPIGIFEGEQMIGCCLTIKVHARRGTFFYCPFGPFLDWNQESLFETFIQYLQELGKKESVDFIRMSPFVEDSQTNRERFKALGFRDAPLHVLAETTWMLNVEGTLDELLMGMDKKHRNLIRRAKKDGVVVHKSSDLKDLKDFYPLYAETVKRHHFVPFSRKYIEEEMKAFQTDDQVVIFRAEFEGQIIGVAVMYYYGNMGIYRHSASSSDPKYRKVPDSYLIQWEAIKEAKNRGQKYYNFWGIAPEGAKKHPFAGLNHFKTGFGGQQYDLMHCQDLPLTKKYWLNFLVERWRKWKRGF